jgi:hypothetical protein
VEFSSGNSSSRLVNAVLKIGPECTQEGAYCKLLGRDVCPEIYGFVENGYVMEKLVPRSRDKFLLQDVENILEERVWNRPALPSSVDVDWKDRLKMFGIEVPDWVASEKTCMVHGDPTASNVLLREDQTLICDPRPPRDFMPQFVETDMGILLQSFYKWEVAAYHARDIYFDEPKFMSHPDLLRKAMFWLRAKALRIAAYEKCGKNRPRIFAWCTQMEKLTCGL